MFIFFLSFRFVSFWLSYEKLFSKEKREWKRKEIFIECNSNKQQQQQQLQQHCLHYFKFSAYQFKTVSCTLIGQRQPLSPHLQPHFVVSIFWKINKKPLFHMKDACHKGLAGRWRVVDVTIKVKFLKWLSWMLLLLLLLLLAIRWSATYFICLYASSVCLMNACMYLN